ncbi:hypothetical protein BIW53_03295 [Pseudoalteromonas byunsanensis]|uniref:Uncharacterized protein n=1 Tax=Pseudoalteromonas byunsanensis TaxID=327939 RepID=A0A1S1NBH4_9GAMM|nr:hypothetical protein BIW53_03295 [Pseudoalteromonas byunsanensis]
MFFLVVNLGSTSNLFILLIYKVFLIYKVLFTRCYFWYFQCVFVPLLGLLDVDLPFQPSLVLSPVSKYEHSVLVLDI